MMLPCISKRFPIVAHPPAILLRESYREARKITAADRVGVRVAAGCAVDTNIGCIRMVVPVKAAEDRPRSPRRGPARVAQCPHERRSGARGEALWAPVGDQCTGAHAAELSLVTRRRRSDGPLRSMRWARWIMRSRMASAKVGSPMTSCQRLTGTWLVTSRDPLS